MEQSPDREGRVRALAEDREFYLVPGETAGRYDLNRGDGSCALDDADLDAIEEFLTG